MSQPFAERLTERVKATNSRVCLGIDPRPLAHPLTHPDRFGGDPAQVAKAVVFYFQAIIEATQDVVACYKPQAAFFEALGVPGIIAMAQLLADIRGRNVPVVLDAKRGDIDISAEAYARAYLTGGVFACDALTVNPYLGSDGVAAFLDYAAANGRGLFVLVKTSNPSGSDLQDLVTEDGRKVYECVADLVELWGEHHLGVSGYSPVGAVVGATYPAELAALRERMPHSLLLVPGYGAQGAGAQDLVAAFDGEGLGAVVNASRGLTYVSAGDDFAQAARGAALAMRREINEALGV
ncbi:orotidine-5'-phosphate decarboxylase [soil metagenome]